MAIEMEGREILYDHYKDTFEQQKGYLAKRDRLTVILMILVILLIGLICDPEYISSKLNTLISAQIEDLVFDFQFINTGLIIAFFWFSLQYYMIVLQIEKMYTYINECEEKLCAGYPDFKINREGVYYLKSYPWLRELADKLFVIGIPLGFVVLAICKIISELECISVLPLVDITFLSLTVIFSLLYISNRIFHEEYFDRKLHPCMGIITRIKLYFHTKDKK